MHAIRPIRAEDKAAVAVVIQQAFDDLAKRTSLEEDLANFDITYDLVINTPDDGFVSVHPDSQEIVGVNFMSKPDRVSVEKDGYDLRNVGPIAVSIKHQGKGIGRQLMQCVIDHAMQDEKTSHCTKSIRLMVDTYNPVSFSLYISLGFNAKETYAQLSGTLNAPEEPELVEHTATFRLMRYEDIEKCNRFLKDVVGFQHEEFLRYYIDYSKAHSSSFINSPIIVEHNNEVVGLTTGLDIDRLSVFTNQLFCKRLFAFLWKHHPPTAKDNICFFVPITEQPDLLRWCLRNGFKMQKTMSVLVYGHHTPARLPSVYLPGIGGF